MVEALANDTYFSQMYKSHINTSSKLEPKQKYLAMWESNNLVEGQR
jgi:hypothetical protein